MKMPPLIEKPAILALALLPLLAPASSRADANYDLANSVKYTNLSGNAGHFCDIEEARQALDNGADPNAYFMSIGGMQITVLLMAAAYSASPGCLELIQMVLEHGANANAIDGKGFTALMYAAQYNSSDLAALLIAHGADVNAADNEGATPLSFAVDHNSSNVAKELINAGANINVTGKQGNTLLMRAIFYNYPNMVAELLESGADVNAADNM